MTKQEMNNILLQAFQTEIQDSPDLSERISSDFSSWVQSLIQQGQSELSSKPKAPQASEEPAAEQDGGQ